MSILQTRAGHEVPTVDAVNNALILVNCRTRSAIFAGLSQRGSSSFRTSSSFSFRSRSMRVSCAPISLGVNILLTSENKSRQILRKGTIIGRRFDQIYQFLANDIIEGRPEAKTSFDRFGCLALRDPDFVRFVGIYRPTLLRSPFTEVFGASHSPSFDQRRRPETLRTAMAMAFFCPTRTTSRLPRVTPV